MSEAAGLGALALGAAAGGAVGVAAGGEPGVVGPLLGGLVGAAAGAVAGFATSRLAANASTKASEDTESPHRGFLAGGCLGGLLGLLVGLSTAPVVAGVVTAVTGLVTGFLAFDKSWGKATLARVAGLGVGAVVLLVVGTLARTHEWLAPNPKTVVDNLKAAGIKDEVAQAIFAYQRYGLPSPLLPGAAANPNPPGRVGPFAAEGAAGVCGRIAALNDAAEMAGVLQGGGPAPSVLAGLLRAGEVNPVAARAALCGG